MQPLKSKAYMFAVVLWNISLIHSCALKHKQMKINIILNSCNHPKYTVVTFKSSNVIHVYFQWHYGVIDA